MNRAVLISIVLVLFLIVSCKAPAEELLGFWKVEQVFIWNIDTSSWQEDLTAPKLYNQFRQGGSSCSQTENETYVMLIPPLTCYRVDSDQLINVNETKVEHQWGIQQGKLEIITQFTNVQGDPVKIKAISRKATQLEAQQDGFPYMRTAVVKITEE